MAKDVKCAQSASDVVCPILKTVPSGQLPYTLILKLHNITPIRAFPDEDRFPVWRKKRDTCHGPANAFILFYSAEVADDFICISKSPFVALGFAGLGTYRRVRSELALMYSVAQDAESFDEMTIRGSFPAGRYRDSCDSPQ